MDQISFSNIAISEELKRAVSDMGYDEATLIQSQSIPLILQGFDLIGRSQTGSGKTAAFGLPAIEIIDTGANPKHVQVLILCPTRELAVQACSELRKFAKYKNEVSVVPIYGGEPIDRQLERLRQGCQIVVGTPGRVMDHMRRKTLKLSSVKMIVLDEADEMLNMGFVEDIETILTEIPTERQTILFSATMPTEVLEITKKFQNNPKTVEIKQAQLTVSTVEQYYFSVTKGKKNYALFNLLEFYQPTSAIIFCNTKKMVDELIKELRKHGYPAQGLHGDMRQTSRSLVMSQFKHEKFNILVATDVAARGIDVNDVKIVINYDLPQEDEYYVHRIGRTGRAGKAGLAFTLVQGNKQLSQLNNIMRYTKCDILPKALPSSDEINKLKIDELSNKILSFMAENEYNIFTSAIENLASEKYTISDIASALFAMSIKKTPVIEDVVDEFSDSDDDSQRRSRRRPSDRSFDKRPTDRSSKRSERSDRPNKFADKKTEKVKNPGLPFKKGDYNDENMVGVKISIGRNDKISPNHILGAVAGETGLPGKIFGNIDIKDNYTTIDVPKEHKNLVVDSMNKSKIKGKKVTAQ
ncbi:MAG: hypothetical protein A2Y15_03195 [Clostridiales bacterium GWF2_36_10]|nr:MAG: hypothetical protein A2Y15_03195 [Clostridiales bacterium GWF2_36_10]HAN20979.1 ATP-dependent RNA helicase [Clostridiales bacterium]